MSDFDAFVKDGKKQFDDLTKQEDKIKAQLEEIRKKKATLKPMLVEAGLIDKPKRKPRTAGQSQA